MNKRYHVMALIIAVMFVLTACSSGGQVMDGEDMVRSYMQISQEEAKQLMEQDGFYHLMNGKFCGEAWDASGF